MVSISCGKNSIELVDFLLKHPHPRNFYAAGLQSAPSSGLFLADVVYDNRMFKNPVPYIEDMMEINSREEDCDFTETKIKD